MVALMHIFELEARQIHLAVNIIYIVLLCLLLLANWLSEKKDLAILYMQLTKTYYFFDSIWICWRPDTVKVPGTILMHHMMTMVGVMGVAYPFPPLRYLMTELIYVLLLFDG